MEGCSIRDSNPGERGLKVEMTNLKIIRKHALGLRRWFDEKITNRLTNRLTKRAQEPCAQAHPVNQIHIKVKNGTRSKESIII